MHARLPRGDRRAAHAALDAIRHRSHAGAVARWVVFDRYVRKRTYNSSACGGRFPGVHQNWIPRGSPGMAYRLPLSALGRGQREHVTSDDEATLECIRCGLGTPILDSGRRARVGDLDPFGRVLPSAYYPAAPAAGMGSGVSSGGEDD
jgi:hypothetical protein